MAKHYTNVLCQGNYILYRGVNNGKKVKNRVTYSPSLFVKSKDRKQEYKGIHGEPLDALRFESIRAAKEFQRKYKDVDNFDIYGMDRFEYGFIADNFKGQIEWNINDINVSVEGYPIDVNNTSVTLQPFLLNNVAYLLDSPTSIESAFGDLPIVFAADDQGHYYIPGNGVNMSFINFFLH